MKSNKLLLSIPLLVATYAFATPGWAGTTGGINGVLTDATTNAPLAGAKITATSPSQVATVTTDKGGHYSFPSLAPDTYDISSDESGYEQSQLTGIEVLADQQQTVNLTEPKATQK
jgi:hypothetical protein